MMNINTTNSRNYAEELKGYSNSIIQVLNIYSVHGCLAGGYNQSCIDGLSLTEDETKMVDAADGATNDLLNYKNSIINSVTQSCWDLQDLLDDNPEEATR